MLNVPSRCVADARMLQRLSLDARHLPKGCEIRFADVPLWRQYWWQISIALAVIIGQTLLVGALFYQRRRRRLAEQAELAQRIDPELNAFDRFALSLAYYVKRRYLDCIEQAELNRRISSYQPLLSNRKHLWAYIRCD
jgi:hypothetical protein